MPAGNITFNNRKDAYGRLIKMKAEFIRKSGVSDIKFTEVEDINLYMVGPIGKTAVDRLVAGVGDAHMLPLIGQLVQNHCRCF